MKPRAVPLVAVGIAGLFLASAVGVVVVRDRNADEVSTDATTTTSFPPFEEETTTSSVLDPGAVVVTDVPPASIPPVEVAPGESTTTSTAAPAAPAPEPALAINPAACQAPGSQPASGDPVGPAGVFTVAVGDGAVRLTNAIGRLPAWRPKANQVLSVSVTSGKPPGLCLSAPDGAGAKRLTTPVGVGRPALSFDGGRVAVRSGRQGGADLVVFSVEGADQKLILSAPEVGDPVWLGNGSAVVTCASITGGRRLVTVPAGGGEPRVIRDSCPPSAVVSSPDGGRIAYVSGNVVTVMNVSNRATTNLRIGTSISTAAAPTWSPDGRRVAFAYGDAEGPALGVLELDAARGVTPLRAAGLLTPSWAPAGDLIAFLGTEGSGRALFVAKPDGTGRRLVAKCQTTCTLAAQPWAPDGSAVALELSGAG